MTTSGHSLRVAVIGGGAAGLSAARVLSRSSIVPVVLEQEDRVGGVWRYDNGHPKTRPMYRGLRTNLPRELMGFREKPWGSSGNDSGPSYVSHAQVLEYLQDYKTEFELEQYIEYGARVTLLRVLEESSPIHKDLSLLQVTWLQGGQQHCQTFDAVCVANGHYSKPAVPQIDGMELHFRGKTLHSIEYDDPAQFAGQTVLCVGGRASGSDLAREISHHAHCVYLSDTACPARASRQNVIWVPQTQRVHPDGSIQFAGESQTNKVNTVIFCTGYDYSFPFISADQSNLEFSSPPGERRVQPLYQQLWHAQHINLAFLGLVHSVVPFPLMELQAEAFVHQLLEPGLPPVSERCQAAHTDAQGSARIQDTHHLGGAQWDYCRRMARWAGRWTPELDDFIATNRAMYDHSGSQRRSVFPGGPDTYRTTCYRRDDARRSFVVTATAESNDESIVTP